MAAPSVCVLRVSSSCLLPLWETSQDQQLGLTQAPFKLLLFPWALERVRFCVCPLGVESVSHSPPAPLNLSPASLQSQTFSRLVSWHRTPGLGSLMWGLDPLLPGENLCNCILLFVDCPLRGMCLDYTMTLPSYPSRCGSSLYL